MAVFSMTRVGPTGYPHAEWRAAKNLDSNFIPFMEI